MLVATLALVKWYCLWYVFILSNQAILLFLILQNKNLSHKLGPIRRMGFGFSYDKLYKYFEILDQQHKEELSQLETELQQLQGEKKVVQVMTILFYMFFVLKSDRN